MQQHRHGVRQPACIRVVRVVRVVRVEPRTHAQPTHVPAGASTDAATVQASAWPSFTSSRRERGADDARRR